MYEPVPLHHCETAEDVMALARAVDARRKAQRRPLAAFRMRVVSRKPKPPKPVPMPPKASGIISADIQRLTAEFYGVSSNDFFSHRRPWRVAHCRQIAMYLCKQHTELSMPGIGRMFRGRDHTTVLHAVQAVTVRRLANRELDDEITHLSAIIEGMT